MSAFRRITPFLWFDTQAEEAATFYTGVFPNSRILSITRYPKEASAASGRAEGSVMTVSFELDGQPVTALNGGPVFRFNEALSLVVHCHDQREIDHYWDALTDGGSPSACGWLKDRYGLSWQVVPGDIADLAGNAGSMGALMQMTKIDISKLKAAAS